jgi:hypothetical protein
MAVITIPAAMAASMGSQSWGQVRYDEQAVSGVTGKAFTRLLGPPRWKTTIGMWRGATPAQAAAWQVTALQLRGGVNHLAVSDFLRSAPLGTLSGEPRHSAAAAGDTSLTLRSAIGTVLAGSWLQFGTGVGSHLAMVTADAASSVLATATGVWTTTAPAVATWTTLSAAVATWNTSGEMVVTFEPPLRRDLGGNGPVTYSKPVAYFKLQGDSVSWQAVPNGPAFEGLQLDLLEDWG